MAVTEGLTFNGVSLNDGVNYTLRGIDFPVPKKRQEWAQANDADGAALVRDPLCDNRQIPIRLRVNPAGTLTMDQALAKVGQLIDLIEECEKQTDGLPVVWTPAQGTKSFTLYALSGEINGIPIEKASQNSGWFLKAPMVTLTLDCKPFGYGTEVVGAATVTADTNPVQTLTLAGVTGDVPAEARLIVTDAATQNRRHIEWGLRQRFEDGTSLLIDSDSLVTTGFAGTQTTRTGAYDNPVAGNNVIRGTLTTTPVAICGTGNLAHVGTYRVKARVYPVIGTTTATDLKLRLSWKEGDGPLRSNDYVTCPAGTAAFSEVDLGVISIPEKQLGTQRWAGQIEAYSITGGDTLDIDYIVLIPAGEGYGKARAPVIQATPTTFSARDLFNQTAGALSGKTADVGGVWTTAGTPTDLTVDATNHYLTRSVADTGQGRGATLPATMTDTVVQVDIMATGGDSGITFAEPLLQARYIDESNYVLAAIALRAGDGLLASPGITVRIAGVNTGIYSSAGSLGTVAPGSWWTMRMTVSTGGVVALYWGPQGGTLTLVGTGTHSSLATAGTLASGLPGFRDIGNVGTGATVPTRHYDNFVAWANPVDATVFSGRSAEIRSDSAIRQDSTGTYYGPISTYRGARFYVPPAGQANRTSRVLVKARRNDIDVAADDQIADSTTVAINYTPRYLAIPR